MSSSPAADADAGNDGNGQGQGETDLRLWDRPRQIASGHAIASIGATPISILGGFALTNAVTAAKQSCHPVWRDLAVLAFGIAVALFISALFFIMAAAPYIARPDERVIWEPEATFDSKILEKIRLQQRQDEWLLDKYDALKDRALISGIICSLLGLGFLLMTTSRTWGIYLTWIPLVVGVIVVIFYRVGQPKWLFPSYSDYLNRPPLEELSDELRAKFKLGVEE